MAANGDKPSIHVAVIPSYQESELLTHICYGIEEEGLPYKVVTGDGTVAEELAYKAAQKSQLGIGIGLRRDRAVLQMNKLDQETPVFARVLEDSYQAKVMGSNAARMIKKIPFKSFAQLDQSRLDKSQEESSTEDVQAISDLITEIIYKVQNESK